MSIITPQNKNRSPLRPEVEQSEKSIDLRDSKGLIVLNPVAGKGNPEEILETVRGVIGQGNFEVYRTTGKESIREVVQVALQQDELKWVAAIGGDGTVSQVADGVAETDTFLAIIPAGTGNALAQELGIPQDFEEACRLLVEPARYRPIDAVLVGKQYFLLQMGIGLESATMQETSSAQKNKWGPLAYLWTAVKEALGWQPYQFTLSIDGKKQKVKASELVVANASHIGIMGLKWQDEIAPDDGRIDIAVVRARSLLDYAHVIIALAQGEQDRSEHIRFFSAKKEIQLDAEEHLPIHGDGEMLDAKLPLEAKVVSHSIRIVVPASDEQWN